VGYFDFRIIYGFLRAKQAVSGAENYSELWITLATTSSKAVMAW
jgi:hypothetical protein